MKKRNFGIMLSLVLAAGTLLSACGKAKDNTAGGPTDQTKFSVGMVTDVGGIDDKSFNQSAWTGLQRFGKVNNMTKGVGGFDYLQSQSSADYSTNLNTLTHQGFSLIYGIGFLMQNDIDTIAKQQPKTHYAIVDAQVKEPNVASILFKSNESSFLGGVVAGLTTKSNKIGFIGGMTSSIIEQFQAGFIAGVKAANPKATVDVQYAGTFQDASKGQAIASRMYTSGDDVIFAAAGAAGNGMFKEAHDRLLANPNNPIWTIGVDSDQNLTGIGNVTINGKAQSTIITSVLKRVDNAVFDISTRAKDGKFPGGKTITYGLAENGVGLAPINPNLPNRTAIEQAVNQWTKKIVSGALTIPSTMADEKNFTAK